MTKVTLNDLLDPYRIGPYRSTFQGYRIPDHFREKFDQTLTAKQRRRKNSKDLLSNALLGKFKSPSELLNQNPEDSDWVLRSADGNGFLLLFNGELASREEVNTLKMSYKLEEGVDYIDARPITFREWKDLDSKYQMASRRDHD